MGFIYFSPPSQVALRDSKTSPRPASARVSWCLETSSIKTPFPERISIPSSFVSLFIFYILSYLLSKTVGCFSGRLMTSGSDQKLWSLLCVQLFFQWIFRGKWSPRPIPLPSWLLPSLLLFLIDVQLTYNIIILLGVQHNALIFVYIARSPPQLWLISIIVCSYRISFLVMRTFKIYSQKLSNILIEHY